MNILQLIVSLYWVLLSFTVGIMLSRRVGRSACVRLPGGDPQTHTHGPEDNAS